MANINNIYIHSQTALPKEYSKLLKEGSSVLVRILKDSGNGKYTASFAGGRYTIESKEKLIPGSTFMAKVSIADGKLNLSKIPNSNLNTNIENKPVYQASNTLSPQVAEMLMSLGLPADNVSKILVQTLVSFGAKINLDKLNKARNAALNFPGQEDEAAEAALILIEKGIEPDIENIRDIMTGFFISDMPGGKAKDGNLSSSNSEIQELAAQLKKYFTDLLNQKGQQPVAGFLTVFNHLSAYSQNENKKSEGDSNLHWIVVPFDFQFKKSDKLISGTGVFRVFLDLSEKNVKNLVINFIIDGEMWTFVVNFQGRDLRNVKFCHYPEYDKTKNVQLQKSLENLFQNVPVEFEKIENLAGFASGDILLPVAKGYA